MFTLYRQSKGKGDALPIPSGSASGFPAKKHRRQRSAELKRMLRAPDRGGPIRESIGELESSDASSDHSTGPCVPAGLLTADDGICLAKTGQGGRCQKKRVGASFCQQHEQTMSSKKARGSRSEDIKTWANHARRQCDRHVERLLLQEEEDIEEATRRSVEEHTQFKLRVGQSMKRLEPMLAERGLHRVPTQAIGNCLFHAVKKSGGLGVTQNNYGRRSAGT